MNKIPISIIIDDPAPLVHIYRAHIESGVLPTGEELLETVPNEFLDRFCDAVSEFGISGKFSVVPMPACRGDIINGIEGYDIKDIVYWLDTVRTRLSPYFDFCPEILTHHKAVNLETGEFYSENERRWAMHACRGDFAKYIGRALEMLRDAGIMPTGVTSPWTFGREHEDEYAAGIADAFYSVFGKTKSWYFLNADMKGANVRPKLCHRDGDKLTVEVVGTVDDIFWETIENKRCDKEYIASLSDKLISEDGKSGQIVDALERGSYPVLITHWQALFSNGRETGLAVLRETAKRVKEKLSERVVWRNFSFLMNEAIERERQA